MQNTALTPPLSPVTVQIQAEITAPCWKALPLDIVVLILQKCAHDLSNHQNQTTRSRSRKYIARLSLTSSAFSRIIRPLLFYWLQLKFANDVCILFDIVKSPRSNWLSTDITRVELLCGCLPPPPLWAKMVESLPSLRHLTLNGTTSKDVRPRNFTLWFQRPVLRKLASLRKLHLGAFFIPSFTNLLRDLGAIPKLEEVRLQWLMKKREDSTTTASTEQSRRFFCNSSFAHIRELNIDGCSGSSVLSWIFTSASLHHAYTVLTDKTGAPVGPVDGHIIACIISAISKPHGDISPSSFRCIEDTTGE